VLTRDAFGISPGEVQTSFSNLLAGPFPPRAHGAKASVAFPSRSVRER
jgi:hypothetical protein